MVALVKYTFAVKKLHLAGAQILFISKRQQQVRVGRQAVSHQIKRQPVHYRELFVSFHSAAPLSFIFLYFTARSSSRPRANSGSIISSINFHPPRAAAGSTVLPARIFSVKCSTGHNSSCHCFDNPIHFIFACSK